MDFDFWASRVQSSTKYLTAVQAARLSSESHLSLDDFEGDDDVRISLPCPFCYVDIELPTLCNHLQEEHCFDVKNAVCPICAANLGWDVIGHFRVQHSHLLKRRRKSQRSGLWTGRSTMFGKELRELSSFHGVTSMKGGGNVPDSAPDPLISPFLCSIAREETNSTISESTNLDKKSMESCTSDGAEEEGYKEKSQKAEFVQQLVVSTIELEFLQLQHA